MNNIDYKSIGKTIRRLRLEHGFTQEELSEQCGISTSYLGYVERGARSLSLVTAVKISGCLHVSLDTLILGGMEMSNNFFASSEKAAQGFDEEKRERMIRLFKILVENADDM